MRWMKEYCKKKICKYDIVKWLEYREISGNNYKSINWDNYWLKAKPLRRRYVNV